MTANVHLALRMLLSTPCALTHSVLTGTPGRGLLAHCIKGKLRPRDIKQFT